MGDNRTEALRQLDFYHSLPNQPVVIAAYLQDGELIACRFWDAAAIFWDYPEGEVNWSADVPLKQLFSPSANFEEGTKRLTLNTYNGSKTLRVKVVHQDWGLVVFLLGTSRQWAVVPQSIANATKSLIALDGSIQGLTKVIRSLAKSLPALLVSLGLLGSSFTILLQDYLPFFPSSPAGAAKSEIDLLLESELGQYPGPVPNAIALFTYESNCTLREFVASHSTYLSKTAFRPIETRMTDEGEWANVLASHRVPAPHVVYIDSLPDHSAIKKFGNKIGVKLVISYPFGNEKNCPQGYISVGYNKPLNEKDKTAVIDRLKVSAQLFQAAFENL